LIGIEIMKLNIINNKSQKSNRFGDLVIGEVFQYSDSSSELIHMKSERNQAICLNSGNIYIESAETNVVMIKATLTYENL
jgi:hypothetical protein